MDSIRNEEIQGKKIHGVESQIKITFGNVLQQSLVICSQTSLRFNLI